MNYTQNFTIYQPSRLSTAIGASVAFAFIIIGILGDLLITVSILYKKELRNNLVNIFIASLQINDLFNIGFNQLFVGLAYAYMEWKGPIIVCEIVVYTSIIITGVQLWHHALIAIHRYLVVVCNQTITYMGMSPKIYVLSSVIIARLIPTLVCWPAFNNSKMIEYSPSALRCILAQKISKFQNLLIVIINMLIPCCIVLFCFLRIFTKVHGVSKTIQKSKKTASLCSTDTKRSFNQLLKPNAILVRGTSTTEVNGSCGGGSSSNSGSGGSGNNTSFISNNGASSVMKREIQITKMFSILFLVFLFGYLPYGIIRSVDKSNSLHPDYYILLTVLFIISISISPVIYGLMNTQIRKQCKFLLNSIFRKENQNKIKKITSSKKQATSAAAALLCNANSFKKSSLNNQTSSSAHTTKSLLRNKNEEITKLPVILMNENEKSIINNNNNNNKVQFDLSNNNFNEDSENSDGGVYKGPNE